MKTEQEIKDKILHIDEEKNWILQEYMKENNKNFFLKNRKRLKSLEEHNYRLNRLKQALEFTIVDIRKLEIAFSE